MRILGHKFGFLIGNEFRIFYDDAIISNDPIQVASFGFNPNNTDGISLCDILDKNICSNQKLKEYAIMHIKRLQTQEEMKRLKIELLNNDGEKLKEIVKNKLVSDGYDENYINEMLENIVISNKSTNTQQVPIIHQYRGPDTNTNTGRTYDYTRYRFKNNVYAKNRLVLAIVKDYINNHENCTYESLRTTFFKSLQGSLGVFDTFESADEIHRRTGYKRHFLNNNEIITLRSGQRIAVCTQWEIENIRQFIDRARDIGYDIEEV
jgi:hypothetical protein